MRTPSRGEILFRFREVLSRESGNHLHASTHPGFARSHCARVGRSREREQVAGETSLYRNSLSYKVRLLRHFVVPAVI